jgi:hypothetical protein
MYKNIIKNHLSKRFLAEDMTPGIKVTDAVKKKSGKINKDGVKDIEKEVKNYDKSLKQTDKNIKTMAVNKYNYTDDAEKTYHDEMEILNGQEMIEYSSEPGEDFKKRAEEAIEGSSRMGNEKGGNAEEVWGASSDEFGKKLVKRIKDSAKKRAEAEIQTYGMGDVQIPTGKKVQTATTAVGAKNVKGDTTKVGKSSSEKPKTKIVKENNKTKNKESMKRLKFKKEFNGVGNALKLIPESYRTDKKEFEMTDGNETYRIRWEGTLSEGRAVILRASDKKMVNEDMQKMKHLMGYKSQDTLGLVKGNARIDENAVFSDVLKKTKILLGESEEIEDQTASEGDLDDAVGIAKEAKKHVEGSVSTDKGTEAPAPKKGAAESLDKAVSQAPEAKKHVEGSVSTDKGTKAPAPKEGEWDEISVPQAPEAKKHTESGKSTHKATDTAKVVKENEEEEEEVEDTYYKSDDEDSTPEVEPSSVDISTDIPAIDGDDDDDDIAPIPPAPKGGPKLMVSQSTGDHYLMVNNKPILVPPQYLELAKRNPSLALDKIQNMEISEETNMSPEAEADATSSTLRTKHLKKPERKDMVIAGEPSKETKK